MSAIHVADIETVPVRNNTEPAAPRAQVRACMSWPAFPLQTASDTREFDPRAAGRRAVEKHADALRRLSD